MKQVLHLATQPSSVDGTISNVVVMDVSSMGPDTSGHIKTCKLRRVVQRIPFIVMLI